MKKVKIEFNVYECGECFKLFAVFDKNKELQFSIAEFMQEQSDSEPIIFLNYHIVEEF